MVHLIVHLYESITLKRERMMCLVMMLAVITYGSFKGAAVVPLLICFYTII